MENKVGKKVFFVMLILIVIFSIGLIIYKINSRYYIKTISGENVEYELVVNDGSRSLLIDERLNEYNLLIQSDKDSKVTLEVSYNNLFSGEFEYGYIDENISSLKLRALGDTDYRTTTWIDIPVNAEILTLSGNGFNRATWQFMLKDGTVVNYYEGGYYRSKNSIFGNKSSSTVFIPWNAVKVRVYYARLDYENSLPLDDEIQIEVGALNTSYTSANKTKVEVDLQKGESLEYDSSEKSFKILRLDGSIEKLDFEEININQKTILNVTSDNKVKVYLNAKINNNYIIEDGIYGVKCDINGTVCERTEDNELLNTNYIIDEKNATPYKNDFDYIYPWSEIKLCNVVDNRVIYEDEEDFRNDGTNGNVWVEIPKHYIKREQIDNYEYIYISKTERDGFYLDPSFITSDGEVDKIYISAYLSSDIDNKIVSYSNTYPVINKSAVDIESRISEGEEIGLEQIFTIQRLFMVEMAVLDSQTVFTGNTNLTYYDYTNSGYNVALENRNKSNYIIIEDTNSALKFNIGDSITIKNSIGEWENFESTKDSRTILDIDYGENIKITFSGEPVDIIKDVTQINHVGRKNGQTDVINYHTGTTNNNGLNSFKYRNIENLYGTVFVLVNSNSYVIDNRVYIGDSNISPNYLLPTQNNMISTEIDGSYLSVSNMGYDEENSWIMLPSEVGTGSTANSYSDFFYLNDDENKKYLIFYGGTWDNSSSAGIFTMRIFESETDSKNANGSRLMLIK